MNRHNAFTVWLANLASTRNGMAWSEPAETAFDSPEPRVCPHPGGRDAPEPSGRLLSTADSGVWSGA